MLRLAMVAMFVGSSWCVAPLSFAQVATQVAESPASARAEKLKERDSLRKEAVRLRGEGKPVEALAMGRKVLAIERTILPVDAEDLLNSIKWLAATAEQAEDWQTAESLRKESLEWCKKHRGAEHWKTTDARLALDDVRRRATLAAADRRDLKRAVDLNVAVARLYDDGKFADAIAMAVEARELYQRILGEKHHDYARILNNLASLYRGLGDNARAEPLYVEALAIRKEALGKKHPDYASSLNNLAAVYLSRSDHARAEPLLAEALAIDMETYGKKHPKYALGLNNLAVLYYDMENYARAEPLFVEALAIRKDVLGERHPSYAANLNSLGDLYRRMDNFAQAEPLYVKALAILKQVRGKAHPEYLKSLRFLAGHYMSTGNYDKAEPLYVEIVEITKQTLGVKHHEYASSLNNLAAIYRRKKDYVRAELLLREALAIDKESFGAKHPEYALALNNLAIVYCDLGNYARAETLHVEALAIRKEALGAKHPVYAASLNNLAAVYWRLGDFVRAEPLYVEALEIRKEVVGKNHPDYVQSLNGLGMLYMNTGNYAQAKPLLVEALAVCKQVLGEEHFEYATSLNNLASLYMSIGEYARAEPLFVEAIAIRKQVLGEKHPEYANCLNNLALMYMMVGNDARAEPLYVEFLAIRKQTSGAKHLDYAQALNNLALLYNRMGDFARAEPCCVEAREIFREALGEKHPFYATSLTNLAGVYEALRDYQLAEPLYVEALAIFKEAAGANYSGYATTLNSLAKMYESQGDYTQAEPLYRQSIIVGRGSLEAAAAAHSERQQWATEQSLRFQLDGYVRMGLNAKRYSRDVYGQVLAWKGASMLRQRGIRLAAADPAVNELFTELQRTAQQLESTRRAVPTGFDHQPAWQTRLAELTREIERLDAEICARSDVFRQAVRQVTLADLLATMPADAVLVDYLEFTRFTQPRKAVVKPVLQRHLAAFVILRSADPRRQVTMLDLGPVAPIAAAIDRWRRTYGAGDDAAEAGTELRHLVWEPVLEAMNAEQAARNYGNAPPAPHPLPTLLISTDGVLGQLPFAAFPGAKPGTYLIEDHRLAMIPVPQLLPTLLADDATARAATRPTLEMLVLGDVDYDHAESTPAPQKGAVPLSAEVTQGDGDAPGIGGDDLRFAKLVGTKAETEGVTRLFRATHPSAAERTATLTLAAATEARFRELAPTCRYLHAATHGFFAPARFRSAAVADERPQIEPSYGLEPTIVGHHPGLLSGLALAGANREPTADGDDGILTAQEIGVLNLSNVDTVVLSACDTGFGETAGGEGLLGVQRAFQVSGVLTTVASFWKVDDQFTRLLVDRFYRNLWESEMSRLDALREAQLYVLNHPEIARGSDPQPDDPKLRTAPRYWAAFTLSGEWR